ncbi:hypothetical protein C5E45_29310 [Nocardia nova]|uniref:DUF4913 domain-containing protein n=1 Tax=Nocardia nova TaxID=37330 RepID=A0A2S6AHP9_9NOCA|nr:hypothetical protein [Nocardia nova]PPJ23136.1 hypothetical protein C5E41_25440 [Nocardia nova]PPJ34746.1 hypothetical protein C5E45_29310 [Nocardia nova]
MPEDRPQHTVYYGFDPTRPVAFTVPPVEATPEQPLPDAGPFLRVCAGVAEPTTVIERVTVQLVGLWRHIHEQRPRDPGELEKLNEQINLSIWFIDREAGGHIKEVAHQADTPLAPSTYGQWVAWLVWKYLLYALRQNDPAHRERDAAELNWCIESFNELVVAVQAGRLRLPPEQGPEGDGTEFPPRRVWPESSTTGRNPA